MGRTLAYWTLAYGFATDSTARLPKFIQVSV